MASPQPMLTLAGPLEAPALSALCAQVQRLVRTGARVVTCDVQDVPASHLTTVDALARLQLTARRAGGRIRVLDVPPELADLLALAGLTAIVDDDPR